MSQAKTFIRISENETISEKIRKATMVYPSKQQIEWQKLELTAFIHFGMNTFCDVEWGNGTADPQIFNPKQIDCEQWARVLKESGFKGMILTCKHHDGFCLWPSEYTDYSIKQSPYQSGKGDIVMQASKACKKYGLKFGVYLSPWDRHDSRYGNSPKYNEYFMNQLSELLSNYGDIFEVWFDGACAEGPNRKRQEYDWNSYYSLIRKLQPDAVISIEGPDVRWVGNEAGTGREEEWSVVPGHIINSDLSFVKITADAMASDIASDRALQNLPSNTDCLFWSPAQVDTSIRPGWFYHSWENSNVKSLYELVNIYENSVGSNAELLLNIPPDTDGNISKWDVDRLSEFGEYIQTAYNNNLMDQDAVITDSEIRIKFNKAKDCNCIILEENIENGQRISSFSVFTEIDKKRIFVTSGKTIGNKKIVRFSNILTDNIQVIINSSRAKPIISGVGVYFVPNIICPPSVNRNTDGLVEINANNADNVTYSINDGEKVKYINPFMLKTSAELTVEADFLNVFMFSKTTLCKVVKFGVLKNRWEFVGDDYRKEELTSFVMGKKPYIIFNEFPAEIIIDMNEVYMAKGVEYAPISSPIDFNYNVFNIQISVSMDNKSYISSFSGTLDNIKNNPIPRFLEFNNAIKCRFIKFKAYSGFNDNKAGIGSISLITI